jgi:hypothetical protein
MSSRIHPFIRVDYESDWSLKKQGNVRIDAHFNTALRHTVNCIVLAERQGYFEISQSRDVILDNKI